MVSIKEKEIQEMDPIALSDPPETRTSAKIWANLRDKFCNIIRTFDQWLRYGCNNDLERTKVYHVWPGKNVFFCQGRMVCGPDPKGLFLTTISIIISSWIFVFYVREDLANIIIIFLVILTIIVLGNLILVSSIDPGIIPRNEKSEEISTNDGERSRNVVNMNGVKLKLKYCRICNIFRPARACHCAVCDNCVDKFDHHCPWIGQCIALRNYRYYLTFIFSDFVFFLYILSFSCWRIHKKLWENGNGFWGIIRTCPETLALVSFSLVAAGFLGGLLMFHIYLIAINQTGYENFRRRYSSYKNPYDKGIISNFKEVFFDPMLPSRVDFRAELTPSL